ELARALRDRIGRDAVESHGHEDQGDEGKDADEHKVELLLRRRRRAQALQRLHPRNRQLRIIAQTAVRIAGPRAAGSPDVFTAQSAITSRVPWSWYGGRYMAGR